MSGWASCSGNDGALVLGMINVIINEKLYDREFVEKWTLGFDELAGYVVKFPPERVSSLPGYRRKRCAHWPGRLTGRMG